MDPESTINDLEPADWADPDDGTPMVERIRALGRVPLHELSASDLRLILGQGRAVRTLLPLALERLEAEPFVEGDYFPGDLLVAALRAAPESPEVRRIATVAISQLAELDTIDRATLEPRLRAFFDTD